jgi:hypothetical protein
MEKSPVKLALCALAALALSGCGFVVSDKPVFPDSASVNDPSLAGVYTVRGPQNSDVVIVSQDDAAGYHAAFYSKYIKKTDENGGFIQTGAADFSLIALGGGDYALQVSCFGGVTSVAMGGGPKMPRYQYAVLLAARPHDAFWLGILPDYAMAHRYGLPVSKDDVVAMDGISAERAKAFFREWIDALVQAGGEDLSPVVRVAEGSWLTSVPPDPHPKSCAEMQAMMKTPPPPPKQ